MKRREGAVDALRRSQGALDLISGLRSVYVGSTFDLHSNYVRSTVRKFTSHLVPFLSFLAGWLMERDGSRLSSCKVVDSPKWKQHVRCSCLVGATSEPPEIKKTVGGIVATPSSALALYFLNRTFC